MEETIKLIKQLKATQSSVAATRLVNLYKTQVFNLCFKMLKKREIAEELAQDAFLKAFQNIQNLEDAQKFPQWLMRLTYHIVIDFIRLKKISFDSIESAGNIQSNDNPLLDLENKDRRNKIEVVIAKFPPEESAILTLFYMEDQSIKQIAEVTELSQSNIKIKLFRSREKLRLELQKIPNLL